METFMATKLDYPLIHLMFALPIDDTHYRPYDVLIRSYSNERERDFLDFTCEADARWGFMFKNLSTDFLKHFLDPAARDKRYKTIIFFKNPSPPFLTDCVQL